MKTKKQTKNRKTSRMFKAGLTNGLNEPILHLNKKEVKDLSLFFLEDSLTDYEFNYQLRTLNY